MLGESQRQHHQEEGHRVAAYPEITSSGDGQNKKDHQCCARNLVLESRKNGCDKQPGEGQREEQVETEERQRAGGVHEPSDKGSEPAPVQVMEGGKVLQWVGEWIQRNQAGTVKKNRVEPDPGFDQGNCKQDGNQLP